MNGDQVRLEVIRQHKRWADRYLVIWIVLIIFLFGGVHVLLESAALPLEARTGPYILLAAIVLAGAIWQAAGLAVARIHMLLQGNDARGGSGS